MAARRGGGGGPGDGGADVACLRTARPSGRGSGAALVERAGLPTRIPGVAPGAALEHMRIDKKVQGGRIRLVLLRGIGAACLTADYPESALQDTLQACCG